jgi:DNA-binding transcriptional ArsR family regulator
MAARMKSARAGAGDGSVDEAKVARVRAAMADERTVALLSETFRTLGDPTRTRIVFALSCEELCVGDLAGLLGVTQSGISHQLRVLRNMDLVRYRRKGRLAYYSLDDDHIENLFAEGLRHVRGEQ